MSDNDAVTPRQNGLRTALLGGVIGSLITFALLFFAIPGLLSSRIVRQGLLSDPKILSDTVDALHDARLAPVIAENRMAIETPFKSSWKGAQKPEVTLVEFFDYACPYCRASNPAVDRLLKEDKGLRLVYRELPILGPDSAAAARLSLEASKLGRFAQFHDSLWAEGRPSPETNAKAARAAGIDPAPKDDPEIEAELNQNLKLAGELGATGTPLFVVGDRVLNGAVGYDALKDAVEKAKTRS